MNCKQLIDSVRAYFSKPYHICVERNQKEIMKLLESKDVTCWAQGPIPDTNAFKLAEWSSRNGGKSVIICLQSDVEKARAELNRRALRSFA